MAIIYYILIIIVYRLTHITLLLQTCSIGYSENWYTSVRHRSTNGMPTTCGVRSKQFGKKDLGLKLTSKQFDVPRTTLQRRCRAVSTAQESAVKTLERFKVAFIPPMETELVKHIKEMESMLFGFTGVELRKIAFQFADLNNIEHQFSREKTKAEKQWLRCSFMSRHRDDLSLRSPEATARTRAFNEVSVAAFFDIFEKLQDEKKKFTPD